MKIIGLTGSIATGKSTVSSYLKTKGFIVIDADILAREAVKPNSKALDEIIDVFGIEYILENGNLDRKKLGNLIFKNKNLRNELDKIMLPKIRELFLQNIKKYIKLGFKEVFYDMPLLYESKQEKDVDIVILVYTPIEIQLDRLIKRNNISKKEGLDRINSQISIEEKKKLTNYVIDNSRDLEYTYKQINLILNKLNIDLPE